MTEENSIHSFTIPGKTISLTSFETNALSHLALFLVHVLNQLAVKYLTYTEFLGGEVLPTISGVFLGGLTIRYLAGQFDKEGKHR